MKIDAIAREEEGKTELASSTSDDRPLSIDSIPKSECHGPETE